MKRIAILLLVLISSLILYWQVRVNYQPQTPAPWPANSATLASRLKSLGLPLLSVEGDVLHIHQHLDIYIYGHHLSIPSHIGLDDHDNVSPIHIHDAQGIIHIESPTVQNYTLGQFFGVWGVPFTDLCLGDYCQKDDQKLAVYINGQLVPSHYSDIILTPHQEIVVTYGRVSQLPSPIPHSFIFPSGY